MKSFVEIIEDIKDIICVEVDKERVFDTDVAKALGIKGVSFASLKKRNSTPYPQILDFCAARSISINKMFYNQSPESLIKQTNSVYAVRYFGDVYASAGGGADVFDESHTKLLLDVDMLNMLGGEAEVRSIDAINVSGDSMEPTFYHGDIVFINRSNTNIGRGGLFVISTEGGLFIKRVQVRIDAKIDIISDNKEYRVESVEQHEIELIGRVVGKFTQTP